jgi:TonB family protein
MPRHPFLTQFVLSASFLFLAFCSCPAPISAGQADDTIPNTAASLKSFLEQLSEVAASEDSAKAAAAIRRVDLPSPGSWFSDLLGEDLGKRVTVAYAVNPRGRDDELRKQLATVKTRDREILTTLLVASSSRTLAPIEQAFSSSMKNPQLFFSAKLVDLSDNSVIPLGYFVHVAGAFRFIDLLTLDAIDSSKPLRLRQFAGGPVPKALHKTNPTYPEEARQEHLSGQVTLEVVISTDGSVKEVKPLNGPPLLVEAARNAVLLWSFEPPTYNGTPVELVTPVELSFHLSDSLPSGNLSELNKPLPGTAPPAAYPERGGGLEKELHDLQKARKAGDKTTADAILRSFLLPDPEHWFIRTFGEDVGKQMAGQYIPVSHVLVQQLQGIMNHLEDMKFTDVDVRKFDRPCDDHADDYVYPLLLARSEQLPLYEATFRNGNSYQILNSFVFEGGAFRYIGRVNIPDNLLFDEMSSKASDSPAADAKKAVKLGGNVVAGRILKRVAPIYPDDARRNYVQGTVRLLALIQEDGTIVELRVAKGVCSLSKAAMDAIKQWRYQPFVLNGRNVRVFTTIETTFTLSHQ